MRFFLFFVPALASAVLLTACGVEGDSSSIQAVTSPDNRGSSTTESFWFYEGNETIANSWAKAGELDLTIFPSEVPTTLRDYFWIKNGDVQVSLNPDLFSRHENGKVQRFDFGPSVADTFVYGEFVHELFSSFEPNLSQYELYPTFEVKGKVGESFQVTFSAISVCGKWDENGLLSPKEIMRRESYRDIAVSRTNFESEQHILYMKLDYADLEAAQKTCGDDILASSFELVVRPTNVEAKLSVDFVGIHVKKTNKN